MADDTSTTTPEVSRSNSLSTSGDGGTTTIDQSVVSKVASLAAREVSGVHQLGGTVSGAIASMVSRIRGDEHTTSGVGVEVGTRQAAVDVTLIATYPTPLPDVATAVRDNITSRIEELTGLEVVEVNIVVTDLFFPGDEDEQDETTQTRVE